MGCICIPTDIWRLIHCIVQHHFTSHQLLVETFIIRNNRLSSETTFSFAVLLLDHCNAYCLVAPCDVCCSLGLPWRCSTGARFGNLFFHLSYHVPHHIIFLLVIMIDTSGLSPRTPSLFENPFTFFTNTHHLLQCYHLSFSTKKDCIFPCNTVVNIDVAPRLPVRHIIT
jgi:hypothetical protein